MGHGKDENDDVGACVKWTLGRYQMSHYAI